MERSSAIGLRDARADALPPQRDTVQGWLRNPVEQQTRWQGVPGRRGKSTRYDSAAVLRALRNTPSRAGAGRRIAGIPYWDGHVRFPKHTGAEIWPPEKLTHEASIALYDMARGAFEGRLGEEMKNDPNDPVIVRFDILKQGHPESRVISTAKTWGYR